MGPCIKKGKEGTTMTATTMTPQLPNKKSQQPLPLQPPSLIFNNKTSSSPAVAAHRLSQIVSHHIMASVNPPVFTADVVPQAPEDPLFGLMAAYHRDSSNLKVDLGIGAYRDDQAKPWILPVIKKADERVRNDPNFNYEYLPIAGLSEYCLAAQRLVLGTESPAIKENRVCTFQTISGTGAVHLGALFLSKFHPNQSHTKVYVSNPTWANHHQIFGNVGWPIAIYPYFSTQSKGLDIDGFLGTLKTAPEGSIILLHACAHNPTGVDPTQEQWKQIAAVIIERRHFPFFDTAYQGFASGDLARDGWAIRYFVELGLEFCIAQSFAKNFGLYSQRVGAFHFVSAPGSEATATNRRIFSQLAILQRSEISNPPAYGARLANVVLNDPELFAQWEDDLRTMSGRISDMRKGLRKRLEARGTPGKWNHITDQIGMFSFTGLTEPQVQILREKWHIYMIKNGRISLAGLNSHNLDYVAEAFDDAIRETA
ncbi:Pyridoxal phosphate-dependent transferase [Elaphomyces granulatus]